MTDTLRVILELGPKRRVVAAATDWPGLDRWGSSEEAAIERLIEYQPRYAAVAQHAGMDVPFERQRTVEVIERVPGSSSTDFWGIAHVPSDSEAAPLGSDDLERRLTLLRACWATFDEVAARVQEPLRPGPRSAGRSRDQIIRHVHGSEPEQFSRKVEVRTEFATVLEPHGLAGHRDAYLAAIRTYAAAGRPARRWPIPFLIRRTAHHVMDHAWELEDRNGAPLG